MHSQNWAEFMKWEEGEVEAERTKEIKFLFSIEHEVILPFATI